MSSSNELTEQDEISSNQLTGSTEQIAVKVMKRGSVFILTILSLVASSWLSIAWTIKPDDRPSTDFFSIFYPAADLVAHGKSSDLYPPTTSTSCITPTFTTQVERLFPTLRDSRVPIFLHSPVFAGILAPLSLVSPWLAFNILSFVSLGALAASYSLLAEKKQVLAILMVTFLSISFGPNFHCLSLGQMSIWFGTGILSFGYWACLKKRFVTAGLIWSLLILKPVYLIAPGLIALSLALDKKFKLLVAIATGGLSVFAASALYFSVGVILQWLHAMRLFEQAFLKHNLELSLYEIVGVVPALTVVLPENLKVIGKIVATGVVLLLSIAFIYYLSRLFKKEQSWRSALPKAMVASIVFTPLLAPYIGFYDLSIDWVAAMIILETPMATADWLYVMRFISATFIVMEIYLCLIMLAPHWQFTQPLLFLALVFFLEYKLVSRYIRSDFADRPASDS